ncbi:MAG: 4-hydroxyphenylacetate 3-hydroxylase N-terminal domain-containing protein [Solirubrobacteraceae bacterium]
MAQLETTAVPTGFAFLSDSLSGGREPHLLDRDAYARSLMDGRRVVDCNGEDIDDVTAHPHLRATVETLGGVLDLQHAPETRETVTYVAEGGTRRAVGWQVPTKQEHLWAKREAIGAITRETLGMFGRPPDYGPAMALGFLGIIDRVEAENPEFAQNIRDFVAHSSAHNALSTDLIVDAQSDRRVPRNDRPGTLRVVEDRPDGVVVRGTKVAGSIGNVCHFFTLSTVLGEGLAPDAALWAAIPVGSPGLSLVMREPTRSAETNPEDHPVNSRGEEMDQIIVFDDVFIPRELVFSLRNLELLTLYHESCAYALWHIMTRLGYRAEIFAGVAQAIADILGTTKVPGVRNAISQITTYAQTLKAYSIASIVEAVEWCGVQVPEPGLVAAGRLHSIQNYHRIIYTMQDLCGQGLISRWPEKIWDHPEFGPKLESYLPGAGITAREKNRFFNFVWDLTSSGHAGRLGLFENVNATPPSFVAELVYQHVDRSEMSRFVREYAGIPPHTES